MNEHSLTALARNYMSVWNAQNEYKLDQFAANKLVVDYSHFEKPIEGVENYKSLLKQTYSYFPDIKIKLTKVIPNESDQSITVFWYYEGIHENGEIFGIKNSGQKVKVEGMTLLKTQENLVIKEKGIVDNLSLMTQLKN